MEAYEAEREVASRSSAPSLRSQRSTTSMPATKAHGWAKAACIHAYFIYIKEGLHGRWEGEHEKEAAVAIAWAKVLKKVAQLMIKERSLYSSQDTAPPIELTVCTNDNVAHHSKKHNPIMPTVKIEPLMIETIPIFQSVSLQFWSVHSPYFSQTSEMH